MSGRRPALQSPLLGKICRIEPVQRRRGRFPVEQGYSAVDILPLPQFFETSFYKEWMTPQGWGDVLSVNLDKSATSRAFFRSRAMRVTAWWMTRCAGAFICRFIAERPHVRTRDACAGASLIHQAVTRMARDRKNRRLVADFPGDGKNVAPALRRHPFLVE